MHRRLQVALLAFWAGVYGLSDVAGLDFRYYEVKKRLNKTRDRRRGARSAACSNQDVRGVLLIIGQLFVRRLGLIL